MMGERIKELRKKAGLTQQELAEKLGYVSKVSINQIETGQRPLPAGKVIDTAKALNTSVNYLFGITDDPSPNAKPLAYDTPEEFWKARQAIIDRLETEHKTEHKVTHSASGSVYHEVIYSTFDQKLAAAYHAAPDKDQTAVRVVLDIDENGDKRK